MPEIEGSNSNSLVNDQRPRWKVVLSLAWPVLIQQYLILSVGLYDQDLAGNNAPEQKELHFAYQAAQTTANYVAWFISSCTALVAVGASALVARMIGANNVLGARKVANQAIALGAVSGLIMTPIALLVLPLLINLMSLSGDAGNSAIQFLQPILILLVFQIIEQCGISCLNGAGDTKTGPLVMSGVALVNIPMAWVCFHGLGPIPGLGFFGIGLGTSLCHVIGCVAVLIVLAKGRKGLTLMPREMKPDWPIIGRLLWVSVPASFDTLSIGGCQLWFLAIVNDLGKVASVAHGTAIRCEGLGYMSGQAFAVAAATLVGQYLGANKPREAMRSALTALGIGCAVMAFMGFMFYHFASEMLLLFSPHEHQNAVVVMGAPLLRLVAFAMPPLACIIIFSGSLRSAGDTRFPIILTWIGFLAIRIPLAYLLTRDEVNLGFVTIPGYPMGVMGAWVAMFVDLAVRGPLFLWRFLSGRWKTIEV